MIDSAFQFIESYWWVLLGFYFLYKISVDFSNQLFRLNQELQNRVDTLENELFEAKEKLEEHAHELTDIRSELND